MLTRLRGLHGIERERIVAISRGGADSWYSDIAGDYVDVFDYFSPDELKEWQVRRIAESGGQKQTGLTSLDREILNRARSRLGTDDFELLHPSLMYDQFRVVWLRRRPVSLVHRNVGYRRLPKSKDRELRARLNDLPKDYVAVKAYFSDCLPDCDETRTFFSDLVGRLARTTGVVLLSTGLAVDDHADFRGPAARRVLDASSLMTPRDNLAVQTEIIRGARAVFSTYGGFSYLGPFLGVPALSFYSVDNFNPVHLDVMRRALQKLNRKDTHAVADFTTFNVRHLDLIDLMAGDPPNRATASAAAPEAPAGGRAA